MEYKNMYLSDWLQLYLHPTSMARDIAIAIGLRLFPKRRNLSPSNDSVEFDYKGRRLKFVNMDPRIIRMNYAINEIFVEEVYGKLNVAGKAVLDFGSAIGDSAIYFSLKGAKEVWGYDIEQHYIDVSLKNIELNNIKNIKIFNHPASSEVIDKFCNAFPNTYKAMKLDCEGGEYDALLNSNKLSEFDEIILEYHYGYLNLIKKLKESGFTTEHSKPNVAGPSWRMQQGYIYAKKD